MMNVEESDYTDRGAPKLCGSIAPWIIILAALTIAISACNSPDRSSQAETQSAQFEAGVRTLMEDWHIPGMSICIIDSGEIAWNRGLGVKDQRRGQPVDDSTIFQAASLSKPVFAFAVLRMYDEGLLDLDKPLTEYAPAQYIEETFLGHPMDMEGFNKEWFLKITARMVLSHTSGLQHFGLEKPVELWFEPGTDYYYSSNGTEYLRYIVEFLKGTRIDTLINEYVFQPLDMTYSSFAWRDQYDLNSAPGHDKFGQSSGSIDKYPCPTAQASLYTNAQDYGKFLLAVLKGVGLKEDTYNEMVKPQVQVNPGVHWGLGFGLETVSGGRRIWHWGDGGTHTCYFYGDLDLKSGFVYFTNSFYGLSIIDGIFALMPEGEHPALSFTVGEWSFRNDYLSPSRKFQNTYFLGQTDTALAYYRQVADTHEQGMQFIKETYLQSWASDLLRKGKISDAITMLQLLVDAYYPERSDTCRASARKYHEIETDDAAIRYIGFVRDIFEDLGSQETSTQFAWMLGRTIAELRPVILDEETLRSFTGSFDPFEITYENGHLFFGREGAGRSEMIAIDERTFMLKDVDYFKVKMIEQHGSVSAARGIWSTGRTQLFMKTR